MSDGQADPGQVFGSVWDALEDSAAGAANMRVRSELMIAIERAVTGWGITPGEAAARLEVTAPRLRELLAGEVGRFDVDGLMVLARRCGLSVEVQVRLAA